MAAPIRLSTKKKKQLRQLVADATQACNQQRFDACERMCRSIDALQPGNPDAARLRGIVFSQCGMQQKALHFLKQAIAAAPNRSDILVSLGQVQRLLSPNSDEALACFEKAMQLDPRSIEASIGYCNTLISKGYHEKALETLQKEHARQSKNAEILLAMQSAYKAMGQFEQARNCLLDILKFAPGHYLAHYELAAMALAKGDLEEAVAEARTALSYKPDAIMAHQTLAQAKKFRDPADPDIAAMLAMHEKSLVGSDNRRHISFVLGKAMEDVKQFDRAFEYFLEGNEIRHRTSHYDPQVELEHINQIIATYTPDTFSHAGSLDDATPIFIFGMPRCGSTLTEQILAAHPTVDSKGEWGYFEFVLHQLFNSEEEPLTFERIAGFGPEEWNQVGETFLERVHRESPSTPHITDKSLTNIRLVGAIHCALPKAKIVHVRRHPLDTCLSIFKTDLQGYLFDFGTDLSDLGHYYKSYLKLMQHWREVLPAGAMYELDYEILVQNQEEETRKLLEFCGLPWDEQCLQFNKAKNIVKTASIAQVRKPIYKGSMAAWKRYETQLQPLIDILGPEFSTEYQPGQTLGTS